MRRRGDQVRVKGERERERNRYSLHPSSMASNLLAATSDALHPSSNGLQPVRERERERAGERETKLAKPRLSGAEADAHMQARPHNAKATE